MLKNQKNPLLSKGAISESLKITPRSKFVLFLIVVSTELICQPKGGHGFVIPARLEYPACHRCSWIMSIQQRWQRAGEMNEMLGGSDRQHAALWSFQSSNNLPHLPCLPLMKENRWLHLGLCSAPNDSSKGGFMEKKLTLNEDWIGPDSLIDCDTDSVAKQT